VEHRERVADLVLAVFPVTLVIRVREGFRENLARLVGQVILEYLGSVEPIQVGRVILGYLGEAGGQGFLVAKDVLGILDGVVK